MFLVQRSEFENLIRRPSMGFKTIDETWRTRTLADWLEAILVAPYISRAIATHVDVRSTDPYAHQDYDIY